MPFTANLEGVVEAGGSKFAPAGIYLLRVTETLEKTSAKGHPQVQMELVINSGVSKGVSLRHYVTFLPSDSKGAGFGKHFLKLVDQAHEGNVTVDASKWNGKVFKGRLDIVQNTKDGVTYNNNELSNDSWHKDDKDSPDLGLSAVVTPKVTASVEPVEVKGDLEEVPF